MNSENSSDKTQEQIRAERDAREIEIINAHAEELNREMEDVLEYQDEPSEEESLALMEELNKKGEPSATVHLKLSDIVLATPADTPDCQTVKPRRF